MTMQPAILKAAALFGAIAVAAPAAAQNRGNASPVRPTAAVPAAGTKPLPAERSNGAAHASPRAIEVVCSSNTPAAERAAICRGPLSRG
jgi:hypothetical protein